MEKFKKMDGSLHQRMRRWMAIEPKESALCQLCAASSRAWRDWHRTCKSKQREKTFGRKSGESVPSPQPARRLSRREQINLVMN